MPYVLRARFPGAVKPMFTDPMPLAAAEQMERALKRRHGFNVEIKHVAPRVRPSREVEHEDALEDRLRKISAAARRAS